MHSFFKALVLSCLVAICHNVRAEDHGQIQLVSGDLVYISGLNGSAPEGAQLATANTITPSLEVIKHVNNLIVARKLDPRASIPQNQPLFTINKPNVSAEGRARRQAVATRVANGPKVDGRLDDAVWDEAVPVDGFIQRDPDYWMPSTERTVAKIIYDDDSIYFAFECYTSENYRLVANNMRRDSEIWGDDNVQLLLDTYNDRQTGFFFFINADTNRSAVVYKRDDGDVGLIDEAG